MFLKHRGEGKEHIMQNRTSLWHYGAMVWKRIFLVSTAGLLSVIWLPLLLWFRLRYGRKLYSRMLGQKLKAWKLAHVKRKAARGGFRRLSWPRRKFRRFTALFIVLIKEEIKAQKAKRKQELERKIEQLRRAVTGA
jgi:hypothetical protein